MNEPVRLRTPIATESDRESRQRGDGAFFNAGGTVDPKSAQGRVYNTTQGLVTLHALGVKPRKISDEEIVQRLVYALVNEGAKIVDEGIALRASDVDMVYLTGYGFPLHRGGPMCYADTVGLFNVVATMKRFAKNPLDDAEFWKPAPLLAKLAAEGKTFS